MSKKVANAIAIRYAKVRKGVTEVMGGKVLEYEAKNILRRGINEGKIEGKIETYAELVKDGLISLAEAAKRLGLKEKEFKKYL